MLDRLKSLPLTIILTILIWMYAEAQFTTQHEGVAVNLRIASVSKDYAVRVFDANEGRWHDSLSLSLTVQGAQNKVDRLVSQSRGTTISDEALANLSYSLSNEELKDGGEKTLDTVTVLNGLNYFKQNGLQVINANPQRLKVTIEEMSLVSRPIVFRSTAQPNIQVTTISPAQAEVRLPKQFLEKIGGANNLSIIAVPTRDLSTLDTGVAQSVRARLTAEYPPNERNELLTIMPVEVTVTFKIPTQKQDVVELSDVPVEVSGSPALLRKWNIEVQPQNVRITVTGPAGAVSSLLAHQGAKAVIDLDSSDNKSGQFQTHTLRYVLPDGLTLREGPKTIEFKLTPAPTK